MNSSELAQNQVRSMLQVYKYRLFWCLSAIGVALGVLHLPPSNFVVKMLVPGVWQYLAFSIPSSIITFLSFAFLGARVTERTLGLTTKAFIIVIVAGGMLMLAWGFLRSVPFWGSTGVFAIFWGAGMSLLPNESMYWQERRNRRRERT